MDGAKRRQYASVITSDQEFCRPMPVLNYDGTVQDFPDFLINMKPEIWDKTQIPKLSLFMTTC